MKINKITPVSFKASDEYYRVKQHPDSFYELSTDEKLNVLFDTLNRTGKAITKSQDKIRDYNTTAINTILEQSSRGEKQDKMKSAERLCRINTLA